MYPVKFYPIYKERIWGGVNLKTQLHRCIPCDCIGESWEICYHGIESSIISNGTYCDKSLQNVLQTDGQMILGDAYASYDRFPLLLKVIDANDDLSVQVHPDDAYAKIHEQDIGKAEAWYILHAKENAMIVYGLNDKITKTEFEKAVAVGTVDNALRYVPVKVGDMIFLPTGTVHALMGGVMVYEVQQNSDVTYRIHDYNRLDKNGCKRALHLEKALDVINFNNQQEIDFEKEYIQCPFFFMRTLLVDGSIDKEKRGSFLIYYVISGSGSIIYNHTIEDICEGETVLIPAGLKNFSLSGSLKVLEIGI